MLQNCAVQRGLTARFTKDKGLIANCDQTSQKSGITRKTLWKQKAIRTNQVNLALPDSRAANSKIATKRNVNANSASVKNKVAAANLVAVNRVAAVSKADDKPSCLEVTAAGGNSRRFSYPRNSSDCDGFSAFVSCARGWCRIDFWKPSVLGYPKALKREQDLLHL